MQTSTRSWLKQACGICFLPAVLLACVTPLEKVVRTDAPGFRIKAPARGDHELGRHLEAGHAVPQACFHGTEKGGGFPSWSGREINYRSAHDARMKADFGETLQPTSSVRVKRSVGVTLDSVRLVTLEDLYATGCAQLTSASSDSAQVYSVITQALSSEDVALKQERDITLGLSLNSDIVGGRITSDTRSRDAWSGTNLYFADLVQRFRVTRLSKRSQRLAVGDTVDVGSCGFTLREVDLQSWMGSASCQNAGAPAVLRGAIGNFERAHLGGGLSVTVRLTKPQLSLGNVDVFEFRVEPVTAGNARKGAQGRIVE